VAKENRLISGGDISSFEKTLVTEVSAIIEKSKREIYSRANSCVVVMFWEVGRHINRSVLQDKRAEYGKQIVATVSRQLAERYGASFEEKNLRRMLQFAEQFVDSKIVAALSRQLSWSHIRELLPLKSIEAQLFYADESANRQLSVRGLRRLIARKSFERGEIADARLSDDTMLPFNAFKDPYLFDILGLHGEFAEADLESAIIHELEKFILEFGKGFTFVERQKRMIIDGDDFHLDLLFYHRMLKRLVAVELKVGKFDAKYKGQMELYLKWLDRYERQEGEGAPIGLILCAETKREQIELLELDKAGIAVAEYWTALPPKKQFEEKIHEILAEARERLERKKNFPAPTVKRQIETFIEPEDDE
jgi:predicted nuclease of restriction endonuclease-like (RecB) superfamily